MKIFQTVQRKFESVGVCRDRISFGLLELKHILAYILDFAMPYVVRVAETPKEYVEAISDVAMIAVLLISYLSIRYKSQAVFKMIDELEEGINRSEYEM